MGSVSSSGISTPIRRTRSPCCASAASGHAAALPSPPMNYRRRAGHPSCHFIGQPIPAEDAWERLRRGLPLNKKGCLLRCVSPQLRGFSDAGPTMPTTQAV